MPDRLTILHDCSIPCPFCGSWGLGEYPDSSCAHCHGSGRIGREITREIVVDVDPDSGEIIPDTCERCGADLREEMG